MLLEHEQALHEIAGILIEHETIDREQFERLLHGEPEHVVLAHDTPPGQTARAEPKPKRLRKPRPRRAPAGKELAANAKKPTG